jgi:hypothetical protein
VKLYYMSRDNKIQQVENETWYRAVRYAKPAGCMPLPAGSQCDEYPFFASTQGGPGDQNGLMIDASLKAIPAEPNGNEGTVYGVMTRSCAMETAPAVQFGFPASGGTEFLVVPLPGAPLPTMFVC